MTRRRRVAIVHPWMPRYRVPFFRELVKRAAAVDIDIRVFYGQAPPEWSDRSDSVDPIFATMLATRFLHLGKRILVFRDIRRVESDGPWDLVVLEQAVRNLETYGFLLTNRKVATAFWGHGRTYTKRVSKAQEWVKQWLTQRGSWFFAYTEGGARAVVDAGFPADRVTVVWNALETEEVVGGRGNSNDQPVMLALGALDETKRLDVLFRVADGVRESVPTVRLVFAGDGAQRHQVEEFARTRGWVDVRGRLDGEAKAFALNEATVILNPGRVGLVAVDSLASEVPIVTARWPYHAPEFEYLSNGINSLVVEDDIPALVEAVVTVLTRDDVRARLQEGCRETRTALTVEAMARNFVVGLVSALESEHR